MVPKSYTIMHGVEVATNDIAQTLALQARVICTRAADYLEEQPEEVMGNSEEEREMDTSITPCYFLLLSSL